MTLPIACPIARKIVIAVAGIQGLIRRQGDQNRLEVVIERGAVTTFGFPLVVALERRGSLTSSPACRPEIPTTLRVDRSMRSRLGGFLGRVRIRYSCLHRRYFRRVPP